MLRSKKFVKAFTLVEMLIVVIIIGILMSALLPKLTWAQAGARDTARTIDVANINTALAMYFNNSGVYPQRDCASNLSGDLKSYIKSIPTDPQWQRVAFWTQNNWCTSWSYAYTDLTSNGSSQAWSVTIANIESYGKNSNWVLSWSSDYSDYDTSPQFESADDTKNLLDLQCDSVIESDGSSVNWCSATQKEWQTDAQNQMVFVVFN